MSKSLNERIDEFMNMPIKDWPHGLKDFADYFQRRYGLCSEVIRHAVEIFCTEVPEDLYWQSDNFRHELERRDQELDDLRGEISRMPPKTPFDEKSIMLVLCRYMDKLPKDYVDIFRVGRCWMAAIPDPDSNSDMNKPVPLPQYTSSFDALALIYRKLLDQSYLGVTLARIVKEKIFPLDILEVEPVKLAYEISELILTLEMLKKRRVSHEQALRDYLNEVSLAEGDKPGSHPVEGDLGSVPL